MKSFDDYDAFAEAYVKHTEVNSHNAYYERPAMFSILSNLKFDKVLDVGCAGGIYTEWLLDRGANVVAIDINHKMVEFTKQRTNNRATVYQSDLNQPLTFLPDNSFDLIVSSLTLHYLPNWITFFQEFNRILLPTRLLLFSTHHPFTDFLLFEKFNYFTRIENIIEPLPTEECQKLYPQDYKKLSTKPWFMIILARKQS